jgi:hypothetical protein
MDRQDEQIAEGKRYHSRRSSHDGMISPARAFLPIRHPNDGQIMFGYNDARTHIFLLKDPPTSRSIKAAAHGDVVALPVLGRLHRRYARLPACLPACLPARDSISFDNHRFVASTVPTYQPSAT